MPIRRSSLVSALPILAALLLTACGTGSGPADEGAASSEDAAANAAAEAPQEASSESDADAASGPAPTSERFELGTNYIRLSPTQPTSVGLELVGCVGDSRM